MAATSSKSMGDAFCAVFTAAPEATAAALHAQRALAAEDFSAVGGIRVRMALHAGYAEEHGGDYFGPALNRVARLVADRLRRSDADLQRPPRSCYETPSPMARPSRSGGASAKRSRTAGTHLSTARLRSARRVSAAALVGVISRTTCRAAYLVCGPHRSLAEIKRHG